MLICNEASSEVAYLQKKKWHTLLGWNISQEIDLAKYGEMTMYLYLWQ